jgi:hypothetical protein
MTSIASWLPTTGISAMSNHDRLAAATRVPTRSPVTNSEPGTPALARVPYFQGLSTGGGVVPVSLMTTRT